MPKVVRGNLGKQDGVVWKEARTQTTARAECGNTEEERREVMMDGRRANWVNTSHVYTQAPHLTAGHQCPNLTPEQIHALSKVCYSQGED